MDSNHLGSDDTQEHHDYQADARRRTGRREAFKTFGEGARSTTVSWKQGADSGDANHVSPGARGRLRLVNTTSRPASHLREEAQRTTTCRRARLWRVSGCSSSGTASSGPPDDTAHDQHEASLISNFKKDRPSPSSSTLKDANGNIVVQAGSPLFEPGIGLSGLRERDRG